MHKPKTRADMVRHMVFAANDVSASDAVSELLDLLESAGVSDDVLSRSTFFRAAWHGPWGNSERAAWDSPESAIKIPG